MNNLHNTGDVQKVIERIQKLTPQKNPEWGTMNAAQMLAHTNISLQTAMGNHHVGRVGFVGRIIGGMLKAGVLTEKPFGKNSPTAPSYKFAGDLNFEEQKNTVIASLNAFQKGGIARVTKDPHPFFGHFTPEQWAIFQWKHFDHHLRQFGV